MEILINILIGLVAFIHLYIMVFEMFAWETRGPKVFTKFPKNLFAQTKALAANQGLYNGFLAAGLVWSLFIPSPHWSVQIGGFFLICVIIAGVHGALTAERKIFFVQSLPAGIAFALLLINTA